MGHKRGSTQDFLKKRQRRSKENSPHHTTDKEDVHDQHSLPPFLIFYEGVTDLSGPF